MIASRLTVRRLLNRLPPPRRATLADLGHAAAMLARADHTPGPRDPDLDERLDALAERLEALQTWLDTASAHYARPTKPTTNRKAAP